MKRLLAVVALMSCATVPTHEEESCPSPMSDSQAARGAMECRALCSSYARDFAAFASDCKCYCMPAKGSGYRPNVSGQM